MEDFMPNPDEDPQIQLMQLSNYYIKIMNTFIEVNFDTLEIDKCIESITENSIISQEQLTRFSILFEVIKEQLTTLKRNIFEINDNMKQYADLEVYGENKIDVVKSIATNIFNIVVILRSCHELLIDDISSENINEIKYKYNFFISKFQVKFNERLVNMHLQKPLHIITNPSELNPNNKRSEQYFHNFIIKILGKIGEYLFKSVMLYKYFQSVSFMLFGENLIPLDTSCEICIPNEESGAISLPSQSGHLPSHIGGGNKYKKKYFKYKNKYLQLKNK